MQDAPKYSNMSLVNGLKQITDTSEAVNATLRGCATASFSTMYVLDSDSSEIRHTVELLLHYEETYV